MKTHVNISHSVIFNIGVKYTQKYYFSQLISRCGNWGRLLSIVSIAADNWNIFAIAASVILRCAGSQFPVMCVTAECELAGARVIIIWSVLRALWAPGRGRWLMIYSLPNNWSQIWTPPGTGKCPQAALHQTRGSFVWDTMIPSSVFSSQRHLPYITHTWSMVMASGNHPVVTGLNVTMSHHCL